MRPSVSGLIENPDDAILGDGEAVDSRPGAVPVDADGCQLSITAPGLQQSDHRRGAAGRRKERMIAALRFRIRLHGPEQPHSVHTLVIAGNRRLGIKNDGAVGSGNKARLASPDQTVLGGRPGSNRDGASGRQARELNIEPLID